MARQKISEYRAKTILSAALELSYTGVSVDTLRQWQAPLTKALSADQRYVVKVDQGIKGRFKKGLVKLDRASREVADDIAAMTDEGFRYFLVEPYRKHPATAERYLALQLERGGTMVTWSPQGGVDVEQTADRLKTGEAAAVAPTVETELELKPGTLATLTAAFEANEWTFLEINPLIASEGELLVLDAAVEVDGEAATLVEGRWTLADFREARHLTPQEATVAELAAGSQASFRLEVINPDGAVFLLLSGGGASVVLADEVFNQGHGRELGNYGEYSGNPNEAETYSYTQQIVSLMLASQASHKVLVIGGGVANFTDVRATFRGVIHALSEASEAMRDQGVRVFVRRGGPFEAEGLATMREFLEREGLLGFVAGPELVLAEIVTKALLVGKGGTLS